MKLFDWLSGSELQEVVKHNQQLPAQMAAKIKHLRGRAETTTNRKRKKALVNTIDRLGIKFRRLVSKN